MNNLGSALLKSRTRLDLGVRELCSRSARNAGISEPISPAYYSRLERGIDVDPEKLSIDKCWSLGLVLQVDPLYLFVLSRSAIDRRFLVADERAKIFPIVTVEPTTLSDLLSNRRQEMCLGLRELAEKLNKNPIAAFPLSPGFLSQIETDFRGVSSVVSGDKLWALGVMLEVDPLLLYVVSRGLDPTLLDPSRRRALFGI
ncbi:MAG: hypothetical protein PHO83_06420 [Geobacteraceae bacterium]|nr:hypothetical protein [Geobacteraceae bacterium]